MDRFRELETRADADSFANRSYQESRPGFRSPGVPEMVVRRKVPCWTRAAPLLASLHKLRTFGCGPSRRRRIVDYSVLRHLGTARSLGAGKRQSGIGRARRREHSAGSLKVSMIPKVLGVLYPVPYGTGPLWDLNAVQGQSDTSGGPG